MPIQRPQESDFWLPPDRPELTPRQRSLAQAITRICWMATAVGNRFVASEREAPEELMRHIIAARRSTHDEPMAETTLADFAAHSRREREIRLARLTLMDIAQSFYGVDKLGNEVTITLRKLGHRGLQTAFTPEDGTELYMRTPDGAPTPATITVATTHKPYDDLRLLSTQLAEVPFIITTHHLFEVPGTAAGPARYLGSELGYPHRLKDGIAHPEDIALINKLDPDQLDTIMGHWTIAAMKSCFDCLN